MKLSTLLVGYATVTIIGGSLLATMSQPEPKTEEQLRKERIEKAVEATIIQEIEQQHYEDMLKLKRQQLLIQQVREANKKMIAAQKRLAEKEQH